MADALSREAAGAQTPSALAAAARVCLARRGPTWQTLCGIHSQSEQKWCTFALNCVRMIAVVQRCVHDCRGAKL
eukprot:11274150-Heterocapsa_arctica.AAC.1